MRSKTGDGSTLLSVAGPDLTVYAYCDEIWVNPGEAIMQTANQQLNEMHQTVRQLVQTIAQTEARHERAMRRQRWLFLLVAMLFSLAFYMTKEPGAAVFAQAPAQSPPQTVNGDPESRAAMREELINALPDEKRQRLDRFEQEVKWVSQYMQTWDKGMEGAVVALMLYKMSNSMESVPQMYDQMKVMNSLMTAMPVMATEMQRMNANMSVITANMGVMTHNMDSTMGRMGRSMPWMPW